MLWKIAKPILFCLDAERAHEIALASLKYLPTPAADQTLKRFNIGPLVVANHVGLAAGMDKNAHCLVGWQKLGFGFVEVGTVTAHPQAGNPKPRLFRLPKHQALFNRMGFNNDGAQAIAQRIAIQRAKYKIHIPIGINIGKSAVVPLEDAPTDYLTSFNILADLADYVAVNVSSPNTKDLRKLQSLDALCRLLEPLMSHNAKRLMPRPVLVKIAPDLEREDALKIAETALSFGIAGLIISNTSVRGLEGVELPPGGGGLSGAPLFGESTSLLSAIREHVGARPLLLGSGGIMQPKDAAAKMAQGADAVQVYTGFVYGGPKFPGACAAAISGGALSDS